MHALETLERDIPVAVVYSAEEDTQTKQCTLRLEGALGIPASHPAAPCQVELHENAEGFMPSFRDARERNGPVVLDEPPSFLKEGIEWRGFREPSRTIFVLPFLVSGETMSFLAIELKPRRAYDKDFQQFVQDLGLQWSTVIKSRTDFDRMGARELQLSKELSDT